MRRQRERPVVLVCDEAYQPAACVCLTSLFINSPEVEFRTFIVTDAPNDRLASAMRRLGDMFARDIRIAAIDAAQAQSLVRSLGPIEIQAHISSATMLRLAVPDLLPIDSFLYLDCDMVVQDNIDPLLQIDLGGHILAAVAEGARAEWGRQHLGLGTAEVYVNAGVLLVDAKGWRQEGGLRRVAEICRQYGDRLAAADQDIINLFSRMRTVELESRWNIQQQDFMMGGGWEKLDPEAFRGIFHFNSELKPWMAWSPAEARAIYRRYASISPWRMVEVTAPRSDREQRVAAMAKEYDRLRALKGWMRPQASLV